MSRESPTALELLLPAGVARGTAVIGSGCPPRLAPLVKSSSTTDLAVLAPGNGLERRVAWAEAAAADVARRMPDSGTAVIIAPAVARRRLARALRGHGFRTVGLYLHLPSFAQTVFAVPLRSAMLRYVVERLIARKSWRRSALLTLTRLPRASALAALAPSTGVVMRRDNLAAGFEWLGVRDGILQLPDRGRTGAVVHGFESGPLPSVIAKIRTSAGASTNAGDAVRAGAATMGIRVPRVLRQVTLNGASATVEEALHGRPAASALAAKGDEYALPLLTDLERLLLHWSRASLGSPLLEPRLGCETVDRAKALPPIADALGSYVEHLETLLRAEVGGRVVAAHNDLTTWNILVDDTGGLALLDWDEAEAEGLPLADFAYAAVDAMTVAGDRDRVAAYRRCFGEGTVGTRIREALGRLATVAQLTPATAELCLHACWLRHASNEHARGERSTPFLEIVREVAAGDLPVFVG